MDDELTTWLTAHDERLAMAFTTPPRPDAIRLDVVHDPELGTIAQATDPMTGASATAADRG